MSPVHTVKLSREDVARLGDAVRRSVERADRGRPVARLLQDQARWQDLQTYLNQLGDA
jgi:hypothetical protein